MRAGSLQSSPSAVKLERFINSPLRHSTASYAPPVVALTPVTCPSSLTLKAALDGPPKVPKLVKSVSSPWLQRNAWLPASIDTVPTPTACPWLFKKLVPPIVPPKLPGLISIILPFSQTNGSTGGQPVLGSGVLLVSEWPENLSKVVYEFSVTVGASESSKRDHATQMPHHGQRLVLDTYTKRTLVGSSVLDPAGHVTEVINPNTATLLSLRRAQLKYMPVGSPDGRVVNRELRCGVNPRTVSG